MDIEKHSEPPREQIIATEFSTSGKLSKPAETKVQVALRVRPFVEKETMAKEQKCTRCNCDGKQVNPFASYFL
jgi:hypothetical protein